MKKGFLIFLLINYIFSMITFFISIMQNWHYNKFFKFLGISLLLLNFVLFCVYILVDLLSANKKEEHSFEMKLETSQEQNKALLKEISNLDEEQDTGHDL